jgi:hypothetical protein
MLNKTVVLEALKHAWESENYQVYPAGIQKNQMESQDSSTSLLIHDVFGGEIRKTHKKNGWHFYNRINGERIDFTRSETSKTSGIVLFEDIPSTPDETQKYFAQEDYSTSLMKFVGAFEEAIGLEKNMLGLV